MNLIETYAANTGVKIRKPYIFEKYYPLPDKKYIVLHPVSKPAKTYDLWLDVLQIILPVLNANNIQIVQVGGAGEKPLPDCIHLSGLTDINQTAYVVKHAELVVGVDSWILHLAGFYNKYIVGLYSNNNINNVKPFFCDNDRLKLFEPNRNGAKPSYALDENPKTINNIPPEKIAQAVLGFLNLPFNYPYNSFYLGELYHNKVIEVIPSESLLNPQQFGIPHVPVRLDYLFNEQFLFEQVKVGPVVVVTKNAIDKNLLGIIKPRIVEVIYDVSDQDDFGFVDCMTKLGIKYRLIAKDASEEKIKDLKYRYMDYAVVHMQTGFDIKPLEEKIDKGQKLFYKTGKFSVFKEQIYPSFSAWKRNLPINTLNSPALSLNKDELNDVKYEMQHLCLLEQ